MTRAGLFYLLGAGFFFSLMTVCVKLAGASLPAEEIIFVRAVIALVLSDIVVRRAGLSRRGVARGLLVLRGLLGSCALYCFFWAVTVLPLAEVTTIHYTNPILTAVLAAVFLGEGIRWSLVAALLISISGVLVVARPQFLFGVAEGLDPSAVGIALLGAMFSAGAYTLVRRLRSTDHPDVVVLYFPLVATPVFLPLAVLVWVWPTPMEWLLLLGVGLTTQVGQVCLTRGLHRVPAGPATTIGYVQIAFAMLWGITIFGDPLDPIAFAGALLVVAGPLIVTLTTRDAPAPV